MTLISHQVTLHAGALTHEEVADSLRILLGTDFVAVLLKPLGRIIAYEALLVSLRGVRV